MMSRLQPQVFNPNATKGRWNALYHTKVTGGMDLLTGQELADYTLNEVMAMLCVFQQISHLTPVRYD